MLFIRTGFMMIFGVVLMAMGGVFGLFIPGMITLMFVMMGALLVVMSYLMIFFRAYNSTLYHLMEDPKASEVKWLYVYGDTEIIVAPAEREMEYQSYSKKLDAQIKEVKMYDFAGHKVRIVPEGIGHSVDLIKCLYAEVAKTKFKAKTLGKLREVLMSQEGVAPEVKEEKLTKDGLLALERLNTIKEVYKPPKEELLKTVKVDNTESKTEKTKEEKYNELTSEVDSLTSKEK